jgi:hypothetical protein
MRIRILSDLHLEFRRWTPPEADADVIVLAGDIHVGIQGVEWALIDAGIVVEEPGVARRRLGPPKKTSLALPACKKHPGRSWKREHVYLSQ